MNQSSIARLLDSQFINKTFDFEALALKVFVYQYENNEFYRTWCRYKKRSPSNVSDILEIPFVPLDIFKFARVACFKPGEAVRILFSSGTTQNRRSRHEFNAAAFEMYARVSVRHFSLEFKKKPSQYTFIACSEFHGDGFMSHKLGTLFALLAKECRKRFITPSFQALLDIGCADIVVDLIRSQKLEKRPLCLAMSYNGLAHLVQYAKKEKVDLILPRDSIVFTGGGPKGLFIPKPQLAKAAAGILGISSEDIIDVFSSTELSGRSPGRNFGIDGYRYPRWWQLRTLNPATLEYLPAHESGLMHLIDLLNFNNVSFLALPDTISVKKDRFYHQGRGSSEGYEKLLSQSIALAKKV